MVIWAAEGDKGLYRQSGGKKEKLAESCFSLCAARGRVFGAGRDRGFCWSAAGRAAFDFPVPPGVCALSAGRGLIYALSAEADCLCAFDAGDGALLLSAPTGSYPRDLCLSPCGRYMAVAAGGAGELLLFDAGLTCVHRQKTAGIPCGVCFLPHALGALCAVESDDTLASRLVFLSPRGVEREIFTFPAAPCALCAMGGHCLAGCQGRFFRLRPDGTPAACRAFSWPARIRLSPAEGPLICDPWQGVIARADGSILYTGQEPGDVCLTEQISQQ